MEALPAARLVNFAVTGEMIVIRTAAGSTIAPKIDHAIIAFEADDSTTRPARAGQSP